MSNEKMSIMCTKMNSIELSQFGKYVNGLHSNFNGCGSFQASILDAFYKASQGNRERLVLAFPEWFNQYDINLDYSELK